jgi:hypothetical protein
VKPQLGSKFETRNPRLQSRSPDHSPVTLDTLICHLDVLSSCILHNFFLIFWAMFLTWSHFLICILLLTALASSDNIKQWLLIGGAWPPGGSRSCGGGHKLFFLKYKYLTDYANLVVENKSSFFWPKVSRTITKRTVVQKKESPERTVWEALHKKIHVCRSYFSLVIQSWNSSFASRT